MPTDYSDARDVLFDVRAQNDRECARLGHESPFDPAFTGCRGDGWARPYMVRSQGSLAVGVVRAIAVRGVILDGVGVGRESVVDVIADTRAGR